MSGLAEIVMETLMLRRGGDGCGEGHPTAVRLADLVWVALGIT